ncbi:hypothetical protein SUGI_0887340 [Cryptomeria japonica]|nr:hypothetical protein SUGI_0887340 [Cryptomeria japonica]
MAAVPAVDAEGSVIFSDLGYNGIHEEDDKYGREMVSQPKKETSKMDANIWRLLPDHLIERVLPWLPVPSIVRSQLVCKSWNSMINSRLFSHYYSEAYFLVEREPWFLVFPKKHENLGLAYDPLENRWINLPFNFLPTESRAVATAEGLICMIPKANNINSLYICNPFSKSWRVVPRPPGLLKFFFLVAGVVVEKMTRSFKMVLAGSELVSGDIDQFVLTAEVYDSETNCWMRSRSFLVEAPVFPWRAISHGILYCVIGQAPWNIIGFNVHNGSWFRISAPMPALLTSVKLMDHKGRLILIGGIGNSGITTEIGMWELNEASVEWMKIFSNGIRIYGLVLMPVHSQPQFSYFRTHISKGTKALVTTL